MVTAVAAAVPENEAKFKWNGHPGSCARARGYVDWPPPWRCWSIYGYEAAKWTGHRRSCAGARAKWTGTAATVQEQEGKLLPTAVAVPSRRHEGRLLGGRGRRQAGCSQSEEQCKELKGRAGLFRGNGRLRHPAGARSGVLDACWKA